MKQTNSILTIIKSINDYFKENTKPTLIFNNKPNFIVETTDNKKVWISRSLAINILFVIRVNNVDYILLSKRGDNVPDFKDYWALTSGYLDWNENATECVYREMYEECGLDLQSLIKKGKILRGSVETPIYINTNPNTNLQNITLRYLLHLELDKIPNTFPDYKETSEVEFMELSKVYELIKNNEIQLAFNHKDIILKYKN